MADPERKYKRQSKRAGKKADKASRKSGPGKRKEGKYVSSQHTQSDVGQKYQPPSGAIGHTVTDNTGGTTDKHTVDTYLTDATGQEFHIGSETTENTTPVITTVTTGDKDGESFVPKDQTGKMYDNNKKFFGDRINEVYKISDMLPNEKGGKVLDKVRSSHITHNAQTYQQNDRSEEDGGGTASITRLNAPKLMTQTKSKGVGGGDKKSKNYVSRKYLGSSQTYDAATGERVHSENQDGNTGWNDYNKSAKDWRQSGTKVISDRRMERMHKRMGNYKGNKTIMGGKHAAGGDDRQTLEQNKSSRENTLVGIENRLMEGTEKPTDIYRETWRDRRNKRKRKK
jgi:hypothetical protein